MTDDMTIAYGNWQQPMLDDTEENEPNDYLVQGLSRWADRHVYWHEVDRPRVW